MKTLGFWTVQLSILIGVFAASWSSFEVLDSQNAKAQNNSAVLALTDEPVQFYHEAGAPEPHAIHTYINAVRDDSAFSRLATSQKLTRIAEQRLLDMQKYEYYAHENPETLETFAQMLQKVESSHLFACENLNLTFSPDPAATLKSWLGSPAHKACAMNETVQYAGYASAPLPISGQQQAYVVVAIYSAEPIN